MTPEERELLYLANVLMTKEYYERKIIYRLVQKINDEQHTKMEKPK